MIQYYKFCQKIKNIHEVINIMFVVGNERLK